MRSVWRAAVRGTGALDAAAHRRRQPDRASDGPAPGRRCRGRGGRGRRRLGGGRPRGVRRARARSRRDGLVDAGHEWRRGDGGGPPAPPAGRGRGLHHLARARCARRLPGGRRDGGLRQGLGARAARAPPPRGGAVGADRARVIRATIACRIPARWQSLADTTCPPADTPPAGTVTRVTTPRGYPHVVPLDLTMPRHSRLGTIYLFHIGRRVPLRALPDHRGGAPLTVFPESSLTTATHHHAEIQRGGHGATRQNPTVATEHA